MHFAVSLKEFRSLRRATKGLPPSGHLTSCAQLDQLVGFALLKQSCAMQIIPHSEFLIPNSLNAQYRIFLILNSFLQNVVRNVLGECYNGVLLLV